MPVFFLTAELDESDDGLVRLSLNVCEITAGNSTSVNIIPVKSFFLKCVSCSTESRRTANGLMHSATRGRSGNLQTDPEC